MSVSIIVISDKEELDAPQVVEVSCNNENDFIEEKEQNAYENEGLSVKAIKYPLEEASHYFEEFCYICRSEVNFENEGNFFNALDTSIRTQHSKQPIVDALTKILGICIKSGIGSLFVCQNCFLIMNRWDEFQIKAEKYQNILKGKHGNAPSVSSFIQEQRCHQDEFDSFENRPIPHGPSMSTLSLNLSLEEQGISPSDPEYLPYNYQSKKIKQRGRGVRKNVLKVGHNHQRELLCQPNSMLNKLVSNEKENSANLDKDLQSNCAFQHPSNRLNKHQITFPSGEFDQAHLFCKSCNYLATDSSDFDTHKIEHFCKKCGLFLTLPSMMNHHLRMVHNAGHKKKFACKYCNKKYSSGGSLYNHVKATHRVKIYSCDICNMTFKQQRLLDIHKVRHFEKNFMCSECDAKFFLHSQVTSHMNQVHRKIKPYQCHKCNKFFCQRSVLNHHLSQHVDSDRNSQIGELMNQTGDSHASDTSLSVPYKDGKSFASINEGGLSKVEDNLSDPPLVKPNRDLDHSFLPEDTTSALFPSIVQAGIPNAETIPDTSISVESLTPSIPSSFCHELAVGGHSSADEENSSIFPFISHDKEIDALTPNCKDQADYELPPFIVSTLELSESFLTIDSEISDR